MSAKGNWEGRSANSVGGRTRGWGGLVIACLGILLGTASGLRAQGEPEAHQCNEQDPHEKDGTYLHRGDYISNQNRPSGRPVADS